MKWFATSRQKPDKVWVTPAQVQVCTLSRATMTLLSLPYPDVTEKHTWSQEPYLCKTEKKTEPEIKVGWILGPNCYVECLALSSEQVANDNVTWSSLTNEGVLQANHHTTLDSKDMVFTRRRKAINVAFRKDVVSQGISRSAGVLGVWQSLELHVYL